MRLGLLLNAIGEGLGSELSDIAGEGGGSRERNAKKELKGEKQRSKRNSKKKPRVERKKRPPDCTCPRPSRIDIHRERISSLERGVFPAVELCPACSRLQINPRPTAQAATEKAFSFHDLAAPNSRPGTAPPRCQEEEVLRALRGKDGLARCPIGCNMTFKRGDALLSHLARDHSNILDRVCAGCLSDNDCTKCHVCTIIRNDPVLAPPQSVDINAPTLTSVFALAVFRWPIIAWAHKVDRAF
jgi:hypothetical protein